MPVRTETIVMMARKSFVWNRRNWLSAKNKVLPALMGARGTTTAVPATKVNTGLPEFFVPFAGGETMLRMDTQRQTVPTPTISAHRILDCTPTNSGKQLVLCFADGTRYELHARWLKDSNPSNVAADFYRTSAADVWKLRNFTIKKAELEREGESLVVHYETTGEGAGAVARVPRADKFEAKWLHSFAPFVGKALQVVSPGRTTEAPVRGTGSLFDAALPRRRPWRNDLDIPKFDAEVLARDTDAQVEFLETLVEPGVAMVTGVEPPQGLEREVAGLPMENLIFKVIGRLNQHPVRSTCYGVMSKTADSAKQGADYDMGNPLSMHTDHSVYHGTPGFLQFLYQAQGSVRSKVCDGLALAEYVRAHHPDAFELLTKVEITHSSRNELYTRDGAPRDIKDKGQEGVPFELVHTHPIIQLDCNGLVEKVVQSETKRGVCALPYSVYEPFMEAYELWTQLCEDARFIKHFDWPEGSIVVTNNWRTLHGRATVPPGVARTMAFGYAGKVLVENRYRLLKQYQTERANPALGPEWLTRVPNQVLDRMTSGASL